MKKEQDPKFVVGERYLVVLRGFRQFDEISVEEIHQEKNITFIKVRGIVGSFIGMLRWKVSSEYRIVAKLPKEQNFQPYPPELAQLFELSEPCCSGIEEVHSSEASE